MIFTDNNLESLIPTKIEKPLLKSYRFGNQPGKKNNLFFVSLFLILYVKLFLVTDLVTHV